MSAAARTALASIAQGAGWAADPTQVRFIDGPSAIASPLPISDVAAGAYGALALAAAEFAEARGGASLVPEVDRRLAGLAMAGNEYLTVNGLAPKTWGNITGYHRAKCGGAVYIHGIFEHLRDGLLDLFGAEDDRAAMSAAIARWTADGAEREGQARGLCVMKLRTRAEWEAHPQRAALAGSPVLRLEALSGETCGEAATSRARPPMAASLRPNDLPLDRVRVLDLTRVIAGPMAGRALAELGADVLRVSAAHLPSIEGLVIDTGFGKRNAEIDLRDPAGGAALRALVRDADVLIDGYRPGALAAKGFGREELAKINPGLVYVTLSAFSDVGPWAGRRGYDSYVQAGVGLTAPAEPRADPIRLPCQPLDYLTGALAALGGVLGLLRRERGDGGAFAELSLARTAMWLWEMADRLGPEPAPPAANPTFEDAAAEGFIRTMESEFGALGALAPPFGFEGRSLEWRNPPRRLGSSPAEWASDRA